MEEVLTQEQKEKLQALKIKANRTAWRLMGRFIATLAFMFIGVYLINDNFVHSSDFLFLAYCFSALLSSIELRHSAQDLENQIIQEYREILGED